MSSMTQTVTFSQLCLCFAVDFQVSRAHFILFRNSYSPFGVNGVNLMKTRPIWDHTQPLAWNDVWISETKKIPTTSKDSDKFVYFSITNVHDYQIYLYFFNLNFGAFSVSKQNVAFSLTPLQTRQFCVDKVHYFTKSWTYFTIPRRQLEHNSPKIL